MSLNDNIFTALKLTYLLKPSPFVLVLNFLFYTDLHSALSHKRMYDKNIRSAFCEGNSSVPSPEASVKLPLH